MKINKKPTENELTELTHIYDYCINKIESYNNWAERVCNPMQQN